MLTTPTMTSIPFPRSRQHAAQVADQPRAAPEQRQGGRTRQEAGAQTQEEPRGEEERGRGHAGLPEGLGRQRRDAPGRDGGGGAGGVQRGDMLGYIHIFCLQRSGMAMLLITS